MDDRDAWVIYFATLMGMAIHPGAGTKGHQALKLAECAAIADEMLRLTRTRWEE